MKVILNSGIIRNIYPNMAFELKNLVSLDSVIKNAMK